MGFAASQARLLMLTSRKSDLELQLQFVQQARTQLANMVSGLIGNTANLEPDSAESRQLNAAQAQIQIHDKNYEREAKRVETQHLAVSTEIESVQKVIQKNIESSFKTFS